MTQSMQLAAASLLPVRGYHHPTHAFFRHFAMIKQSLPLQRMLPPPCRWRTHLRREELDDTIHWAGCVILSKVHLVLGVQV